MQNENSENRALNISVSVNEHNYDEAYEIEYKGTLYTKNNDAYIEVIELKEVKIGEKTAVDEDNLFQKTGNLALLAGNIAFNFLKQMYGYKPYPHGAKRIWDRYKKIGNVFYKEPVYETQEESSRIFLGRVSELELVEINEKCINVNNKSLKTMYTINFSNNDDLMRFKFNLAIS